jgi:hypothetical protein
MRPKKKLSELSPERLRKLSPVEIQRRKELEELELENQSSESKESDINLKNLESISECYKSVINDLEFIEYVIELSKNDIGKNGLLSENISTFKDFISLKSKALKDLVFINKELRNSETTTKENVAFVIPTNEELRNVLNEITTEE